MRISYKYGENMLRPFTKVNQFLEAPPDSSYHLYIILCIVHFYTLKFFS